MGMMGEFDEPRRVRTRWPRKIGGPLDGEPMTELPRGMRHFECLTMDDPRVLDYNAEPPPGVQAAYVGYKTHSYVVQRVEFGAGGRVVDVEVQAFSELNTGDIAWRLLTAALGIPDALR